MQGGPRRGRSPITGPALPRAAQAFQASPEGERGRPQGSKYSQLIAGEAKSRAAQASQASPEGERVCPQGSKYSQLTAGEAKSRAAQASKKEASTHALTSSNCNAPCVGNGDLS